MKVLKANSSGGVTFSWDVFNKINFTILREAYVIVAFINDAFQVMFPHTN